MKGQTSMVLGNKIAGRRRELHMTQEELANAVGVSLHAVVCWENDWNLPDVDKIHAVARALDMSMVHLIGGTEDEYEWNLRDQMFSDVHMFTRLKTIAEMNALRQTYKALYYVREQHRYQFRIKTKFSNKKVPYITHPLMMACHAHSMGIDNDEILAVILLHDVCEDCGIAAEDLPFSDTIREAVGLLTKNDRGQMTKEKYTEIYYRNLGENKIAALTKVIDRCNNVSTMALAFSREKLREYIDETEQYVIPLLTKIKREIPEYNNAVFLIKYQMLSVLESLKAMLMEM